MRHFFVIARVAWSGRAVDGRHGVKVWLLLGAAGSLELGTLDLGSCHLLAQVCLVAEKEFMVVTAGIGAARQTAKAIEIQLTLKGR